MRHSRATVCLFRIACAALLGLLWYPLAPAALAALPATAVDEEVLWILVGGGNAQAGNAADGFFLFASADTPLVIEAGRNPTTGASGMIFEGPFPDCPHQFHYHGQLFGRTDGDLDCGWGKAVRYDQAPESIRELSDAIMGERTALNRVTAVPPQFTEALIPLGLAALSLSAARQAIKQHVEFGDLRPSESKRIRETLDDVTPLDRVASRVIRRLAQGRARQQAIQKAADKLTKAIEVKQAAFRDLAEELGLVESE